VTHWDTRVPAACDWPPLRAPPDRLSSRRARVRPALLHPRAQHQALINAGFCDTDPVTSPGEPHAYIISQDDAGTLTARIADSTGPAALTDPRLQEQLHEVYQMAESFCGCPNDPRSTT